MYRAIYWQSWAIAISFQDKRSNTEKGASSSWNMTVDWIQLWNSPRRPWGDPPLPPRIKKPADTPLSNHNSNLILNEVVVLCDILTAYLVTSLRSFFKKKKIYIFLLLTFYYFIIFITKNIIFRGTLRAY
jgi:hypothetical protein